MSLWMTTGWVSTDLMPSNLHLEHNSMDKCVFSEYLCTLRALLFFDTTFTIDWTQLRHCFLRLLFYLRFQIDVLCSDRLNKFSYSYIQSLPQNVYMWAMTLIHHHHNTPRPSPQHHHSYDQLHTTSGEAGTRRQKDESYCLNAFQPPPNCGVKLASKVCFS